MEVACVFLAFRQTTDSSQVDSLLDGMASSLIDSLVCSGAMTGFTFLGNTQTRPVNRHQRVNCLTA
jgi:hypothetical protein